MACDSQDLRIVLLGVSGAGKTSVGNAILDREAFKESRTRESEIQTGRVEDRNISIIDTPGFFNTLLTDEELQEQMMKSLDLCDPGPHVFLLVVNLQTFEEDQRNIIEKIEEIFGVQAFKFTMVLFTGREGMSKRKWKEFELSEKFQDLVSKCREQYHVINCKNEVTQTQIKNLLKKIHEFIKQNDEQHFNNKIDTQLKQEEVDIYGVFWAHLCSIQQKLRRKWIFAVCFGLICFFLLVFANQINKSQGVKHNDADGVRIVLLGKMGVGKSASANTILGREAFKSAMTSRTVTRECQKDMTEFNRRWITVIDTPGLFDTAADNVETSKETVKCISMAAPGPHAFLLVIPLGQFTQEEKDAVKMIQDIFGDQSRMYTMVLFTRGDDLGGTTIEEFIEENDSLKYLIQECGHRYHVFNNKETEDQTQVSELLEKIDRMVAENGGSFDTSEMFQRVEKNIREEQERILKEKEEEIKRIKTEIEQMKEEFRKREEMIKKETDANVRKEMKKKLEEQKKLYEEENKRKEKSLAEQQNIIIYLKQSLEKQKGEMSPFVYFGGFLLFLFLQFLLIQSLRQK